MDFQVKSTSQMLTELPASAIPADLVIPPRPNAMLVLMEEMAHEEPDLKAVTGAIQTDAALAGAVLKVANSPVFGLNRKASSISQALSLLGLRNISTIASAVAMRHAMKGPANIKLERFWDSSERIPLICVKLARQLRGISQDEAYTVGLFHDCGIPMLFNRFPNYRETLVRANRGEGKTFDDVEDVDLGTNHCTIGYFMAKSWQLPDSLCQSILWHHAPDIFEDDDLPPVAVPLTKQEVRLQG